MTKTGLAPLTVMVKFPLSSVATPLSVLFSSTVAPAMGAPSLSLTVPLTCLCWAIAHVAEQIIRNSKRNCFTFFICSEFWFLKVWFEWLLIVYDKILALKLGRAFRLLSKFSITNAAAPSSSASYPSEDISISVLAASLGIQCSLMAC